MYEHCYSFFHCLVATCCSETVTPPPTRSDGAVVYLWPCRWQNLSWFQAIHPFVDYFSFTLRNIQYQWCRFILSIGGDNLQFHPNFAPFSKLGRMKHDHYCFHVSKSSEDQKRSSRKIWRVFVPKIKRRPKKNVFTENWSFCPRKPVKIKKSPKIIQRSDADHSQIIGEDISPPGFGTPVQYDMNVIISKTDSRHINDASKLLDYAMSPWSFPFFLTN